MEAIKERCEFLKTITVGDETFDYCKLEDMVCLLVGGYECEYYEAQLKEKN